MTACFNPLEQIVSTYLSKLKQKKSFDNFPNNYLAIDIETNGLNPWTDLILEFGWCKINNGSVVENDCFFINWLESNEISRELLENQLERISYNMLHKKGVAWSVTLQKILSGLPPKQGAKKIYEILNNARNEKIFFVTHNGFGFDCPFIELSLAKFDLSWRFDIDEIVDTGLIEKALEYNSLFMDNTIIDFYRRISSVNSKTIKWALDQHCVPKYQLNKKVDVSNVHDAAKDSLLTSLLFEYFKEQLNNR